MGYHAQNDRGRVLSRLTTIFRHFLGTMRQSAPPYHPTNVVKQTMVTTPDGSIELCLPRELYKSSLVELGQRGMVG